MKIRHFQEKTLLVSREVCNFRLDICRQCKYFSNYRCLAYDSFLPVICRRKSAACPLGKWSSYYK